jgi:hypothetical protein
MPGIDLRFLACPGRILVDKYQNTKYPYRQGVIQICYTIINIFRHTSDLLFVAMYVLNFAKMNRHLTGAKHVSSLTDVVLNKESKVGIIVFQNTG